MSEEYLIKQLEENFGLVPADSLTEEKIKSALTGRIVYLLINDLPKLWNALYRIDVNEKKVKELFAQNNPKLIAPGIADLILKRLEQKLESRKKYK